MKSFQATIAVAGKDVENVERDAATKGSEAAQDAKDKKVIFDLGKKTIFILAFSLRLIREKGFQSQF
jgi:hypothetical protein